MLQNHERRNMTDYDEPASSTAFGPGELANGSLRGQERIYLKTAVAALEREQPQVETVNVNTMLVNQAVALQEIFARLLVKANNCTEPDYAMSYISLALKSQAQSRATLQTLAEISAPRHGPDVRHPDDPEQDNDGEGAA
jgi:hypothetical protein